MSHDHADYMRLALEQAREAARRGNRPVASIMMFNNVITAVPHVKTGRLRALAVTTANRSPALPEVPTVAEPAYPGFESSSWQGIVTRSGRPQGNGVVG